MVLSDSFRNESNERAPTRCALASAGAGPAAEAFIGRTARLIPVAVVTTIALVVRTRARERSENDSAADVGLFDLTAQLVTIAIGVDRAGGVDAFTHGIAAAADLTLGALVVADTATDAMVLRRPRQISTGQFAEAVR
jgi:hypothetical protein